MGQVGFVDSSGLGALISTLKILRAEGGDLKLANVGEQVQAVLEITRLLRVFETYESAEEALAAIEQKPAECPEGV
jgi:anti-sigma B factor antagonist